MTLEEKVSDEITWVETAKGIAPYLNVTIPEVTQPKRGLKEKIYDVIYWPLAVIGWRDKELEKQSERMCKEVEEENARMYKEMGLETQPEKDAFTVAQFAGLYLDNVVRYGNRLLVVSKEEFEELLDDGVFSGIMCLRSQYKEVNPDFKDKAKEWLLNEIYTKASTKTELKLLERVSLTLGEKGNIYLR